MSATSLVRHDNGSRAASAAAAADNDDDDDNSDNNVVGECNTHHIYVALAYGRLNCSVC